jgi:hypothetical protein
MMRNGNRVITIKKDKLLAQIIKNKANHIKEYNEAVIAYKKEAEKQIVLLQSKNAAGELNLRLDLVTPINNASNYDSIIEMFQWEIKNEVELTQGEFKEYVQDENSYSEQAMFANTHYLE